MTHIYGIDEQGVSFETRASELAPEISKWAEEVDKHAQFPEESLKALREAGLFGLCIPKEFGGHAQTPGVFAAVVEQIAMVCPSTAMIYVMHITATQTIVASKTLGERESLLRDIAQGKHLSTLAFSERGSRSHFWAPVSQLNNAENGFVTNAQKSWVTSANYANSYVCSAQMPNAASPLESILYLANSKSSGVKVTGKFEGLGLRGNDSAPVSFENLAVLESELLCPLGEGMPMMLQDVLPWFAIGTAAMAHGLCRAVLAATQSHLIGSELQHLDQKLRDLPNLRARVAEMSCRTEASRALLGFTVQAMLMPNEQTPLYVLQSRLSALEAALEVTDLAMKACGGAAFSRHLRIEQMFRDARAGWVMAPTVDHLQEFVGRALTGLPLF